MNNTAQLLTLSERVTALHNSKLNTEEKRQELINISMDISELTGDEPALESILDDLKDSKIGTLVKRLIEFILNYIRKFKDKDVDSVYKEDVAKAKRSVKTTPSNNPAHNSNPMGSVAVYKQASWNRDDNTFHFGKVPLYVGKSTNLPLSTLLCSRCSKMDSLLEIRTSYYNILTKIISSVVKLNVITCNDIDAQLSHLLQANYMTVSNPDKDWFGAIPSMCNVFHEKEVQVAGTSHVIKYWEAKPPVNTTRTRYRPYGKGEHAKIAKCSTDMKLHQKYVTAKALLHHQFNLLEPLLKNSKDLDDAVLNRLTILSTACLHIFNKEYHTLVNAHRRLSYIGSAFNNASHKKNVITGDVLEICK